MTPYQYLTRDFLIQIHAVKINISMERMTCLSVLTGMIVFPPADLNANSDSLIPEYSPLQDFNHLNNNLFKMHLSIPMYYYNVS